MMRAFIILLIILLTGCKTTSNTRIDRLEKTETQAGILLSCNGYKIWQDCFDLASKQCNGKYYVIAKDENLVMQARTLRVECEK